ncbi:MAG: dephospho-CoA kinase, partial [Acidimicrobiales bacterium]
MLRVGLTGGIGSGKSTVARRLVTHGAVLVDADRIAREVVEPGTTGFAAVVAGFGPGVVAADGTLDRTALARVVFADESRRRALNGIVHPLVA